MTGKSAVKAQAASQRQPAAERVRVTRQPGGMWLVTVDGVGLVVLPTDAVRPVMLGRLTAEELLVRYSPADPAGL